MNYEIVAGIPSYNEGENIKFVAEQVDKGLAKFFPHKRAIIVNCDGESSDNTTDFFMAARTKTEKLVLKKKGVTGKGNVFKELFKFIKSTKAKYCMVVDADLKSITPEWVKHMLEPLTKEYEYIVPFYSRHKYDGTITNNLCFPLVYALLNKNIRQPIGGDFAFHGKLTKVWLNSKWTEAIKTFGIDIFMTVTAIQNKAKIGQVNLGSKIHKPSAPNLSNMFLQVMESLFSSINEKNLFKKNRLTTPRMFGLQKTARPQNLTFDHEKIKTSVLQEYQTRKSIIKKTVSPEIFEKVNKTISSKEIAIDASLWSKIVYDCFVAFKKNKKTTLKALQILYFARVYSFVVETLNLSCPKAEEKIIAQAKIFRKNKNYLLNKLK